MKLLFLIVLLAMSFSACGSPSTPVTSSLNGTWTSDDPSMVAHISSTTIQIDLVSDGDSALYWKGTTPASVLDGADFVSIGDTKLMEYALLASLDDTKQFTYTDNKLVFKFSMMGISKTVELSRGTHGQEAS